MIGTTSHKFVDTNVKDVFLPCISYNLSNKYVQLLPPQTYHHIHVVISIIKGLNFQMVYFLSFVDPILDLAKIKCDLSPSVIATMALEYQY